MEEAGTNKKEFWEETISRCTDEEKGYILAAIFDNATNGDMIRVLYPQYEIAIEEFLGVVTVFVDEESTAWMLNFDLSWWNAPYRRDKNANNTKDK